MYKDELIALLQDVHPKAQIYIDTDGHALPVCPSKVKIYWYSDSADYHFDSDKEIAGLDTLEDDRGIYKEVPIPTGDIFSDEPDIVKFYLVAEIWGS